MNKNWCVYVHTNKINGKKYIGITSRKPEVRWKKDGTGYREGKFRYAIRKYRWDNFNHEIIAKGLTQDEANELEVKLIAQFNTRDDSCGYNIVIGGGSSIGFTHNEKTKAICGLSQKGGKSVRAKKVVCDNIVFDCMTDCANHYNVPKETLVSWLKGKHGAPQKFIDMDLRYYGAITSSLKPQVTPSDRTVLCDGLEFNTVKECAEFYRVSPSYMSAWLNGNANMPKKFFNMRLSYSDRLDIIPSQQSGTPNREVVCAGIVYNTINECASHYNVGRGTMNSWLLGTKRIPSKFIKLGLRYFGDDTQYDQQIREKQVVICENNTFETILDCANHYNIIHRTMCNWLDGSRKMPKQFYDMGLSFKDNKIPYKVQTGTKKKIICDGEIFNSLTSCAKHYEVNISTMSRWLSGTTGMPNKFKELGLSYHNEN